MRRMEPGSTLHRRGLPRARPGPFQGAKVALRPSDRLNSAPPPAASRYHSWKFQVLEAVIELCRATGEKTCYLKVTLKNGFISSYSCGGAGDTPDESISIAYTEIEWEYKQLNPDDFSEKTTVGHKYNLGTNVGE